MSILHAIRKTLGDSVGKNNIFVSLRTKRRAEKKNEYILRKTRPSSTAGGGDERSVSPRHISAAVWGVEEKALFFFLVLFFCLYIIYIFSSNNNNNSPGARPSGEMTSPARWDLSSGDNSLVHGCASVPPSMQNVARTRGHSTLPRRAADRTRPPPDLRRK